MSSDEPIPDNVPRWFRASPLLPGPLDSPPPAVNVEVEFGARSRRAPQRFANDDHYLVMRLGRYQDTLLTSLPSHVIPQRFDEFGYGMLVANGMGVNGEAASRIAVTTLVHLVVYFGKWHLRIEEPIAWEVMDRGERFYRAIDSALLQAGRHGGLALESTLTAVFTVGNDLFFAHVGDSRAYLFRDDKLMRLTHDHTFTREHLGGAPNITLAAGPEDLRGVTESVEAPAGLHGPRIDVERLGLLDGDTVFMCTNGLTDMIDEERIADVLRLPTSPDTQCQTLVDLAMDAGGREDATALVARYRIPV